MGQQGHLPVGGTERSTTLTSSASTETGKPNDRKAPCLPAYCAECGAEIRHGARGLCLACFIAEGP
jgi:hypothetical protein